MNFTVSCNKAAKSHDPQAAVTCLLTGKPPVHSAPTTTTVYRGFPLPQVIDILDWLGGGKAFAKLDLAKSYGLVPVREEDRGKTAVVTHCGLFEFISMPFGLKTAGATF